MPDSIPYMAEADEVTVLSLTDNQYDALRPDTPVASRYRASPGASIHAEHGLSWYVEVTAAGETNACIFDFGLDPAGVSSNIEVLGVDRKAVRALALSHGHYDHWMGMPGVLKRGEARIDDGTPFFAGEEAFARRFSLRPGSAAPVDLGRLSRDDIEAAGLRIVETSGPVEIVPGLYLSGTIGRTTAYEHVPPGMRIMRNGELVPDDFRGEQALLVSLKGKGLVIISGCAHAGIVNTVLHARAAGGVGKVHAILGGFHLANARPEVIGRTVDDIRALNPDHIVPAHCTGFEATVAFFREMPDAFILNSAGTRYTFTS